MMENARIWTDGACAAPIRLEWYGNWSCAVEEAFAAMPFDPLMDVEVVRRLWEAGAGRERQRIAVLRDDEGRTVGVIPLRKRSVYNWHMLTDYVLPYSRFFVRPGYTEAALAVLGRHFAGGYLGFYETPAPITMLKPEESWVVALPGSYSEMMQRSGFAKRDRRIRRHAEKLELREDRFEELPLALDLWQQKWAARGSLHTARRRDEMLLVFQTLAGIGRLKTFSLYDGAQFVGVQINVLGPDVLYNHLTISRDEYRAAYPGVRTLLASLEWACGQGLAEMDMLRTASEVKRAWAEPTVRGWRLICSPLGFQRLGLALEAAKNLVRHRRENEEAADAGRNKR